ncbi:MAG: hypothetical protein A2908_01230 [Candidatus Staskawiczbacteria bacterium RIFCSPLOWO2_01_FULL_38_12b]|uniref:Uncharacterized protein n=1 Tax=Candidatus Staskawiczbacteria bacterium RIFCSPLOWO2_01_FULL_38_12b TaxID=1802214 RepID=A0A1G2IGB5_9BACT|nr:MAG: hypothetical protein A2908_01230 [Candidatus Staskawiczbacteria bacterium RIFCSPLOWO2_01_FULL_38_12b]
MQIIFSPNFLRNYDSLPEATKDKAENREIIFRKNPFDKRLDLLRNKNRNENFRFLAENLICLCAKRRQVEF